MVSRNPDELREDLERIEFEGSTQTLTILRSEADKTVERQLATLADIDDKASRMLRLNVLLVGVVVSALSIASQLEGNPADGASVIGQFQNVYVELAVASIVLSTALAAITYSATEYDGGVSAENLERLLLTSLPHGEAEEMPVKNYAIRINFNRSSSVRNIPLITATIVFAVIGVVLFTLGIYQATVRPIPWWLATVTVLTIGVVAIVSGVIKQTFRAVRDVWEWR